MVLMMQAYWMPPLTVSLKRKNEMLFLMLSGCHGFKIDIALKIHIFVRFRYVRFR